MDNNKKEKLESFILNSSKEIVTFPKKERATIAFT